MPYYAPHFRKKKEDKKIKTKMLVREGRKDISGGKKNQNIKKFLPMLFLQQL